MTEEQAQAASDPAAAERQDAESADSFHVSGMGMISDGALQQDGVNAEMAQPAVSPIRVQDQCADVSQASQSVASAEPHSQGTVRDETLDSAEMLIIEDAAELTCDQAAVILRQLAHECQAAEASGWSSTEDTHGASSVPAWQAVENQSSQLTAHLQFPACIPQVALTDHAEALTRELEPSQSHQTPHADLALSQEQVADHLLSVQRSTSDTPNSAEHSQHSRTPSSSFVAAGVVNPYPAADSSAASLGPDGWPAVPRRDAVLTLESSGRDHDMSHLVSLTCSVSPQAVVSGSSFLQRLQMSKQAGVTGSDSASLQAARPGKPPLTATCLVACLLIITTTLKCTLPPFLITLSSTWLAAMPHARAGVKSAVA